MSALVSVIVFVGGFGIMCLGVSLLADAYAAWRRRRRMRKLLDWWGS